MAPVPLSPNIHEEIYEKVRNAFVDFGLFDQIVSKQLKQLISDADQIEIDAKSLRKLTEKYFDVESFKSEQQKVILQQIHLILRTAYVVILSYHENVKPLMWSDVNTLLEHYPQFQGQDEDELKYLLIFRNYLRVALIIIPARLNKQLLLKIAAKLEGSRNEYITGGGQKPCVTRRVEIYEQEGNIQPEKRQDRVRPPTIPGKKRQGNNPLKDLKLLRLPSEEVRTLTKAPSEPQPKSKTGKGGHRHKNPHSNNGGNNMSNNQMMNQMEMLPPGHPFAQIPMTYFPYPYPYYNGNMPNMPPPPMPNFMSFEPNFNNVSGAPGSFPPPSFDDSIVTDSMNDLFAFGTTPRNGSNTSAGTSEEYPAFPAAQPSLPTVPVADGQKEASPNLPPAIVLPSSTFAPVLNREQSELIDRLLLPESDFWSQTPRGGENIATPGGNNGNISHPLQLMRDISWDIYNGTFETDLKNVFGEW